MLFYYHLNPIKLSGDIAETMKVFGTEPILSFSINADIFINQTIAVIILALIAVLYPLIKILHFNVMKAMRS